MRAILLVLIAMAIGTTAAAAIGFQTWPGTPRCLEDKLKWTRCQRADIEEGKVCYAIREDGGVSMPTQFVGKAKKSGCVS